MAKKNPPGHPPQYKPEYCQMLIDHMSEGLSFESFAAKIDKCKQTIYVWTKKHSDFAEAKEIAFAKCQLFWESQGIDGLYSTTEMDEDGKPVKSKSINATVWIFNMKNRFKWRDKQPDEAPDTVVNNTVNAERLTDEQLDARIAEKMKKLEGA